MIFDTNMITSHRILVKLISFVCLIYSLDYVRKKKPTNLAENRVPFVFKIISCFELLIFKIDCSLEMFYG